MPKRTPIRSELIKLINERSPFEVEKVDRYCNLLNDIENLDKEINESGRVITTINGSQEFKKENPALSAKLKALAQIRPLDDWFENKRAEKGTKKEEKDWSKFTK